MIGDKKRLTFIETGNGFPRTGDVLINHQDEECFLVLPDEEPGDGRIETGSRPGDFNSCLLVVEELDYEEHMDSPDVWEI
jgi:hypothetical protein